MVFADSSVLIPLAKIGELGLLKEYFKKVKISDGVKRELVEFDKPGATEIRKALQTWIEEQPWKGGFERIEELSSQEAITESDASIILLAARQKDSILTNDYRLHCVAKTKAVKTMWLTTFILMCVKKKLITRKRAKQMLFELVEKGMYLGIEVYAAIERKFDEI